MIDVDRNNRATGSDFIAHELRRDLFRDALRKLFENGRRELARSKLLRTGVLFVELVADDVVRHVRDARAAHVFADGDEFHLRRDDAGAGVLQLRDDLARLRAERLAALAEQAGKFH